MKEIIKPESMWAECIKKFARSTKWVEKEQMNFSGHLALIIAYTLWCMWILICRISARMASVYPSAFAAANR